MGSAEYYLRVKIIPRVVSLEKRDNAEDVETWPEEGGTSYDAKPLSLTAGEEIREGVKEGSRFLKIEIKGRSFPVNEYDRLREVVSGQLFRITGKPVRLRRTTVLTCETLISST